MFTFDEFCGSLGTSIFGNSSLAEIIFESDYLSDYLFISYDYAEKKSFWMFVLFNSLVSFKLCCYLQL